MKITCQSCQSKYTVSDEKVQGKTVKIKCRKCGATILVSSGGVSTGSGSVSEIVPGVSGADAAASYLVNVSEGDQRSMTMAEIVAAYQTSVVTGDTYVWADGMADWAPLAQVEAIVNALNAADAGVASADGTPAASEVVGHQAEPARGPSPSGSMEVPAAQEPAPRAAAKRDNPRRGQDLFGQRSEEVVSSSSGYTNGTAGAVRSAPNLGAREENSMLFSLSALTAKVASSSGPASQPAPRATTARDREDSGIIDLKALAAAAAATQPATPASDVFLPGPGLFPLGAPAVSAPVAAPPVVTPSVEPPKSKTALFMGGGALVAVAAIVGAFMFMRGGPPPPPPTPAANDAASASPTAAPTSAPTGAAPSASASASGEAAVDPGAATAAASASAKVAVKTGGPRTGGPGPGKTTTAPPTPPPAAATPPPAAPKKNSCGCAAGDLMCAMKCSAK